MSLGGAQTSVSLTQCGSMPRKCPSLEQGPASCLWIRVCRVAGTDPAARAALGCLQISWKTPTESGLLCHQHLAGTFLACLRVIHQGKTSPTWHLSNPQGCCGSSKGAQSRGCSLLRFPKGIWKVLATGSKRNWQAIGK